jgi:hypothetical protein
VKSWDCRLDQVGYYFNNNSSASLTFVNMRVSAHRFRITVSPPLFLSEAASNLNAVCGSLNSDNREECRRSGAGELALSDGGRTWLREVGVPYGI